MPSRATDSQRQFVQYHQRVLNTNPIAYWPLNEQNGTVAYGWAVRPTGTQNGTHAGVTLGQPGIGDGNTVPYYDGANDYTNILTATFSSAFNGATGAVAMWLKMANAGVWTDGVARYAMRLSIDANNYIILIKSSANNILTLTYTAGGVIETATIGSSTTDWFHLAMTWSKPAEEVRYYYNGVWQETDITLGVWAGAFAVAVIGAANTTPAFPWQGYIAHTAIWTRALSDSEIAALVVI